MTPLRSFRVMASAVSVVAFVSILLARGGCVTLSSGDSSSSAVPCYLHPAGDGCHYSMRLGSESCTTPQERRRVSQGILLLNRTLVSLEQQLIRLGVSKCF